MKRYLIAAALSLAVMTTVPADVSAEWKTTDAGISYIKDGRRLTGWQDIGGARYYFNSKGVALTGKYKIGKKTYWFDSKGKMLTSWVKAGGKYYYLGSDGAIRTGLRKINGRTYYFASDGTMQTGNVKIKGKVYTFGADGALISASVEGIVPIDKLENLSSLKKKCTDAEFQAAYNEALKIVEPLVGMDTEDQLVEIAVALRMKVEEGEVQYSTSAKHYADPYGYFVDGVASCAGCTRATGLCLNMLGISYEHVNENQWSHQWCRVKIGKKYYICDAYGLYCGPEPAPYKHPYLS